MRPGEIRILREFEKRHIHCLLQFGTLVGANPDPCRGAQREQHEQVYGEHRALG